MNTKKLIIGLCMLCMFIIGRSQVGISTTSPSSTLDVTGKLGTTDLDGLQAPRLTRAQLTDKTVSYGTPQTGALIYITDVSGGTATGQRVNITEKGYYYFDSNANVWQRIGTNANNGKLTTTLNETPFTFTANQATDIEVTNFYAPITVGTAGYILQSNGDGAPTWTTPVQCSTAGTVTVHHGATTAVTFNQIQKRLLSSGNTASYRFTGASGTSSFTLYLYVTFTDSTSKVASSVQGTLIVTDTQGSVSNQISTTDSSATSSISFPAVSNDSSRTDKISIDATNLTFTFS